MRMGRSALLLMFFGIVILIWLLIFPYSILLLSAIFELIGFLPVEALILGLILWLVILSLDIYMLSGFKIIKEWERAAILKLGKYIGMLGPGLIHIWRGLESYASIIDLRVQAITATSEQTMTRDNVPVDVDAIVYWKVIDPEKAILNVSNYRDMVSYISQTSLREIIGEHELDVLIAEREKMGARLREIIDKKTEEWGVQIISVEVRDIKIPQDLQDAMARQAQAERERRARVILASAEYQAAEQFIKAAEMYGKNRLAVELRWMNILYELGVSGKGNLIFVPSWMPEMKFDTLQTLGMISLKKKQEKSKDETA